MANSKQAGKRVRQARRRRVRNVALASKYRTCLKQAREAIAAGSPDAPAKWAAFVSVADSISGKGTIPANRTARLKSRLAAEMRSRKISPLATAAAAQPAAQTPPGPAA